MQNYNQLQVIILTLELLKNITINNVNIKINITINNVNIKITINYICLLAIVQ